MNNRNTLKQYNTGIKIFLNNFSTKKIKCLEAFSSIFHELTKATHCDFSNFFFAVYSILFSFSKKSE